VFSMPMTAGGYPVAAGGKTQMGGGKRPWVAFRTDVMALIMAGNLGQTVGNIGINVATIVGHEGVHLLGGDEPHALAVTWSFIP
ncbi:MAG: hypothetical protein ABI604_18460, partial [Nitrospirota bacterium]